MIHSANKNITVNKISDLVKTIIYIYLYILYYAIKLLLYKI